MEGLTPQGILNLWEAGQGQAMAMRAVYLAAVASGRSYEDVLRMPVGTRNQWILRLRRQSIGDSLPCKAICPQCSEESEFMLDASQFLTEPAGPSGMEEFQEGDLRVQFRMPDTGDLVAASRAQSAPEALRAILERCVQRALLGGTEIEPREIPDSALDGLSAAMEKLDPAAEILISLRCAGCNSSRQLLLDPASYLWAEVTSRAKVFLRDVHQLARAYGWSEENILAMSESRRGVYLDMLEEA